MSLYKEEALDKISKCLEDIAYTMGQKSHTVVYCTSETMYLIMNDRFAKGYRYIDYIPADHGKGGCLILEKPL